ncbi:MAG: FtsW/RodA/SpoVE family cell cycle protein [Lachnospiraceae bacterium]
MFAIHFIAFTVFYLKMDESTLFYFYGAQAIYLGAVLVLFRNLYPRASKLLVNNMCMLITIGFIMLTRISYDQSMKQFKILAIATVAALIIPILVKKLKFLDKLGYIYALGGIGLLGVVLVFAKFSYGSKLSLSIGGFTFQPSEFVKIIFVFAVASLLAKATDFKHVVITTAIAGAHVLILVVSKDLGSALIFFVTYLVMLYVGTRDWRYLFLGITAGVIASVAAYFLFSHVRVRVQVWKDPFASYTGDGYQVAQSLFAIGAGGWFGTGLYQGSPTMIPIVEQDFMFSAICEELGGFFAICLILIYMSCFIMFVNIAFKMENKFARLASLGLGCTFSVQVFLTVGGAMKMIPSTGVTLPFISYGGSSIMSTVIMFAIVQGFYISRREERGEYPDGEYGYYDEYGNFYPGPDGYAPYGYDENGYPYPYPEDGHENGYPYEGDGYGYPENGYDNGYPYQENGYMPYQQVGYDENFPDPQNSGPDLYAPDRGYGMNEYDEETDGSEEESNEKKDINSAYEENPVEDSPAEEPSGKKKKEKEETGNGRRS